MASADHGRRPRRRRLPHGADPAGPCAHGDSEVRRRDSVHTARRRSIPAHADVGDRVRMIADTTLTTNPHLFGHARGPEDFEVSAITVEIAQYFLEPHTAEEAIAAGFKPDELDMARKVRLVVPTESSSYRTARLWEDRGWSRAAFLMQSAFDRDPVDPEEASRPDSWRPAALR